MLHSTKGKKITTRRKQNEKAKERELLGRDRSDPMPYKLFGRIHGADLSLIHIFFRYIGTLLSNLRLLNSVNKFRPVISGIFSDSPERVGNQCQNSALIDTRCV